MLGLAEQRGEAGAGVEAREAAPVDRPVAADERRRLQIAEERVVLDPRHRRSQSYGNDALDRREVSELAAGDRVVLLGQKADVVA